MSHNTEQLSNAVELLAGESTYAERNAVANEVFGMDLKEDQSEMSIEQAIERNAAELARGNDIPSDERHERSLLDEYAEADRLYFQYAKEIVDRRKAALKAVLKLFPQGFHWQDKQGVVFQICPREQAIVDLTPSEIKRTQRAVGETYVLARKAAEELGYEPFKPEKSAKAEAAKC